jgi:hypothetical protein
MFGTKNGGKDMQLAITVLPEPQGHKQPCILFPNSIVTQTELHIQEIADIRRLFYRLLITGLQVSKQPPKLGDRIS